MEAVYNFLNGLISQNKQNFPQPELRWINPYTAAEAQEKLNALLQTSQQPLFKGTKPLHRHISAGCTICGNGKWSCLFITGKCNANCFYCPAPQNEDHLPVSQSFTFETPESYAEYISLFGYEGASFSGGEPLMVFERVLAYLHALRQHCKPSLYIWMYTNGILASPAIFEQLGEKGLNEIRFDIGATAYSLDKLKMAQGHIKNITIEIPAVPDKKELIMELLPQMAEAGVTNLNLHQLRLTAHNLQHFIKKDYTYIPAERPVVLESEFAALEIINYAKQQNINIGINYCSFHFKNRFQKAGYRRQVASAITPDKTSISEQGYIRQFDGNRLRYLKMKIADSQSANNFESPLQLAEKKYFVSEQELFAHTAANASERESIERLLLREPEVAPAEQYLFDIWKHEYIEKGIRDY